jgi:hypothetical protein
MESQYTYSSIDDLKVVLVFEHNNADRNIGFSDFVHRPKTQYFCVLYTIVGTL